MKRSILVILAAALFFALAGCGSSSNGTDSSAGNNNGGASGQVDPNNPQPSFPVAIDTVTGQSGDGGTGSDTAPGAGIREVQPEWWGAKGDGVTDDRAAIISALASGGKVRLGEKTYRISKGISFTGKIDMIGEGKGSIILSNGGGPALTVTAGDDSTVDNIGFNTTGNANMVQRWDGNGEWLATPIYGYNLTDGYQLSGNDSEWKTLSKKQKTYKMTGLKFISSNNVKVSRIYGRFVGVQMVDCNHSSVSDSDFQAGTNSYTGIAFMATTSTKLMGNSITNNKVRYASTCGITFEGQDGIVVSDNQISMSGESGIKSMANTYPNINYTVSNNWVKGSHWDGIDLLTNFPVTGNAKPNAIVSGNVSDNNRFDGINVEGENLLVTGNQITRNGNFGIWARGVSNSRITSNVLKDNTTTAVPGYAAVFVLGNNNSIDGNDISNSTEAYQVNTLLFVQGNENQYIHNRLSTTFANPIYTEGINNQGIENTVLKN